MTKPELNVLDRLERLERSHASLLAKDEIRDCIYAITRGMDRIERELMRSGFHDDAQVCWASAAYVPVDEFMDVAMRMQATTSRVQHLVGNILIELRDDEAGVESYEIGRHLTPFPDGAKDLIIASRYLDTFQRRDGVWKIQRRLKVIDWMRIMEGADATFERMAFTGRRDRTDESYRVFVASDHVV